MEIDSPDIKAKKPAMIQNFTSSVIGKATPKPRNFRKPKVDSYMPSPNQKLLKASVLNK